MIKIDAEGAQGAALAREFKAAPFGPYSADLQKLLQLLRWGYVRGRTVIVCTKPYVEWRLGRMGARRGLPVEVSESEIYSDYGEANWACFRARWQEVTDRPCPVD